jgi:hypothetical protein
MTVVACAMVVYFCLVMFAIFAGKSAPIKKEGEGTEIHIA